MDLVMEFKDGQWINGSLSRPYPAVKHRTFRL